MAALDAHARLSLASPRARALLSSALLAALLVVRAAGASPLTHGGLPLPPPLHERLAEASIVAIVEIERVSVDRLFVTPRYVQRGHPGEHFALKRSGTKPAEVVVGDRILVLARGARSPFSPVEPTDAVIRVRGDDETRTWRRALRALARADSNPQRLLDVFGAWLDDAYAPLREEAKRGVEKLAQDGVVLGRTFVEARVETARNPALPIGIRSDAAYVACLSPGGAAAMVEWLPGGIAGADPTLVETILTLPTTGRGPGAVRATLRILDHPDADVRRAALRSGAPVLRDPAVLARLADVARDDPDPRVRANAARLIGHTPGS